jgi:hypothetical protein
MLQRHVGQELFCVQFALLGKHLIGQLDPALLQLQGRLQLRQKKKAILINSRI